MVLKCFSEIFTTKGTSGGKKSNNNTKVELYTLEITSIAYKMWKHMWCMFIASQSCVGHEKKFSRGYQKKLFVEFKNYARNVKLNGKNKF